MNDEPDPALGFFVLTLAITALALFVWPGIGNITDQAVLVLLPTIAQALAAVLGLVLAGILVVGQLSAAYSHRMSSTFFDRTTLAYIALVSITIIFTLVVIANPINAAFAKSCLFLSVVCFALLLPFFASFRSRLDPVIVLSRLADEARQQLGTVDTDYQPPGPVSMMLEMLWNIIDRRDYALLERGLKTLCELALAVRRAGNSFGALGLLGEELYQLAEETVNKRAVAPRLIRALGHTGIDAAKEGFDDITASVTDLLEFFARHGLPDSPPWARVAIVHLRRIGSARWN